MLIICTSTGAVHLEVTTDVNATSPLLALSQFIAKRGIPNMIIGDNFKVFKAQCVNFLVRLMAQNGNLY